MRNTPKYNRKKVSGADRKIIMQFGGGLNEVLPSTHIDDGQIAKGKNFYSEDGVSLRSIPANQWNDPYKLKDDGVGYLVGTYNGWYSPVPILTRKYIGTPTLKYEAYEIQGGDLSTAINVSSLHFVLPTNTPPMTGVWYITLANQYAIYWSQEMSSLLVADMTAGTAALQALPNSIKPQKVISHKTRLFVLDSNNTIWWCKAGDYTTWFGDAPVKEYESEEAGYWFIDAGTELYNMEALGDSIFIFGLNKIYKFGGYSEDTFYLTLFATGVGIPNRSKGEIVVGNNALYFVSDNYKVYEFNGNDYPKIISEPEISGKNILNGIAGGIDASQWTAITDYPTGWSFDSLAYGKNKLYFYPRLNTYDKGAGSTKKAFVLGCYVFDVRRRTWHMQEVSYFRYTPATSHNYSMQTIITGDEYGDVSLIASMEDIYSTTRTGTTYASLLGAFRYHAGDGKEPYQANYDYENEYYSWFLTKAFSTVLDGEYKLYEVDVQWRYVGEEDDKRFIASMVWYGEGGVIFPTIYGTGSDFEGGVLPGSGDQMVYKPYEWDGVIRDFKSFVDNQDLAAIDDDDTAWQKKIHVSRFRYKPTGNDRITPFVQLCFTVQYEAIQIDRIELKYRAIGASK